MSACDWNLESPIHPPFAPEAISSIPQARKTSLQRSTCKSTTKVATSPGRIDTLRVPNPFLPPNHSTALRQSANGEDDDNHSSDQHHHLLLSNAQESHRFFHRNKGRTIHTLHRGRARYVIVHSAEARYGRKARVETFVAGHNLHAGERLQWLIEGGKYKASFLLPDEGDPGQSEGLLIGEVRDDFPLFLSAVLSNLVSRPSCLASSWGAVVLKIKKIMMYFRC